MRYRSAMTLKLPRRVRSVAARLIPAFLLARRGRRAERESQWALAERLYRRAAVRRFANPDHALKLASMLDRQGKSKQARAWAYAAIDSTLRAHYDARAAFAVHPTYFAERHEIAEFVVAHKDELRRATLQMIEDARGRRVDRPRVFVYWDRPDRMPPMVAAARRSLHRHVGDQWELVELQESTVSQWADLDPVIMERVGGLPAQFSDYLRLKLLQKHGGLWLDATVYLTGDLWEATAVVRAQEAFLFRYAGSRVGSWFFWAAPDSYVLNAITAVYELWWRQEGRLTNYFLWHDIVEMLYWVDPEYRAAWDDMVETHPRAALAMLGKLSADFDEDEFDRLSTGSLIHKLTYKLPPGVEARASFARHIVEDG